MDPEFDALAEDVTAMSIYYNPNSAKEKLPRIERQIRVGKNDYKQQTCPCHTRYAQSTWWSN
eukprot:9231118-Ditylum_brightwellii.AAC.1